MEITRSREHTVNLGNYENVKIGASVTLNDEEVVKDHPGAAIDTVANILLDELLKEDLAEALANVPRSQDSHVEHWKK